MKISEKGRGKGRLSAMLARTKQLGSGFSPGLFRLFSPDAKHPAWRPFPTIRHCRARTSDKRRSLRSVPHWAFSRLFPPPAEAGYGPAVPESDMSAETFDVRPLRNSGNQAFSPHHVNSAIAGPGDHPLVGVWGGQPQRNPSSANSNLRNETSSVSRGGRQLNARFLGTFHQLVQGLHDFLGLMLGDDAEAQARLVFRHGGVHGGGHDDALFAQAVG